METVPPPDTTRFYLAMILNLIKHTSISYDKAYKIITRRYGLRGWLAPLLYKLGYYFINYYYTLRWLSAKNGYGKQPGGIAAYFASIGFSYKRALRLIRDEVRNLSRTKRISLLYSYPEYLVKDLLNHMDESELEKMLRSLNTRKRWLRINTLKTTIEDALECLDSEGVVYRDTDLEYMVYVEHPKWTPISRLKCYRVGHVVPQDYSSALVVEAFGRIKGKLLDACSAPGMKLSLIHMLNPEIISFGVDYSAKRIEAARRLLGLLGVDPSKTILVNGDSTLLGYSRVFNYALIDAPCSGLGAVYGDPAVKISAGRKSKLEYYHGKQLMLLRNTARHAEHIVYATCSIHPLEGELVVSKLVDEGLLEPMEPGIKLDKAYRGVPGGDYTYRVYPHRSNSQGFYIAVLKSRVAGKA